MAGEQVCVVDGANSAGQATLPLAKFAARVTLPAQGEALAASMSDYLITLLKATPASRSGSAPELPTATAKPAWKPRRSRTSGPAS
jgi:thioredoxin reductase